MPEKTVAGAHAAQAPARREETHAQEHYISPPVDIYEEGHGLAVVADLPGVEQSGLDVRVEDGILTMRATTSHVAPGTLVEREYQLLNFFRQFELPEEVDVDGIQAELKHGVMTLRLPKKAKARPRKIEVNVG